MGTPAAQPPGYFEMLQRITSDAERVAAESASVAQLISEVQGRSIAVELTPMVRQILAENEAATRYLARQMTPLLAQLNAGAPLAYPVVESTDDDEESADAEAVLRFELRLKDERIAVLERRLRSLMFPDLFGGDDYPPMEPEYFGRN